MPIYFVKHFFFQVIVVSSFHIILIPMYFIFVVAIMNRMIFEYTFKLTFCDLFNNYKYAHIYQTKLILIINYLPFVCFLFEGLREVWECLLI